MVCEEHLRTGNIIITLIRQTGAADGEYFLRKQLTTSYFLTHPFRSAFIYELLTAPPVRGYTYRMFMFSAIRVTR